ncbi:hypothetical protein Tco_1231920, partial [Tanacetum coccineum]
YDWFSFGLILVWIFSNYDEIYDSAVLILTALDGLGAARKSEGAYFNSGHEDVNANGFTVTLFRHILRFLSILLMFLPVMDTFWGNSHGWNLSQVQERLRRIQKGCPNAKSNKVTS